MVWWVFANHIMYGLLIYWIPNPNLNPRHVNISLENMITHLKANGVPKELDYVKDSHGSVVRCRSQ